MPELGTVFRIVSNKISAVATEGSNTISWLPKPDANGYKVYYSFEGFTNTSDHHVELVATVDSDVTSVSHTIEIPHSNLAPITLYYAVTALSESGVESDKMLGIVSVENENLPVQPFITELTMYELDHLSGLLADDSFEGVAKGFPEGYVPFEVNRNHSRPGDNGRLTEDDDLSGKLWAGYSADPPELFLYVEVTDDQTSLQLSGGNPSQGGQYDSIEFGWGNYDVRDVTGGEILSGSPHQNIKRGNFADYHFRLLGQGDGTKTGTKAVAFVGQSIDAVPPEARAIYDQLLDGNQVVGYKILASIPMDQIQNVGAMDAVTPLPSNDEIGYFPFNFVMNDNEGGGRDNQIQWSVKPNADGDWWKTPAQWPAVALVGSRNVKWIVFFWGYRMIQ